MRVDLLRHHAAHRQAKGLQFLACFLGRFARGIGTSTNLGLLTLGALRHFDDSLEAGGIGLVLGALGVERGGVGADLHQVSL